MAELDLSAYLADLGESKGGLVLTGIKSPAHPEGATYVCRRISALDQLRIERLLIADAENAELTDAERADINELMRDANGKPVELAVTLLGDAYQQMLDDGVDSEAMERIQAVVMVHHAGGEERAKAFVDAVGKARARKKPAKKTASTRRARGGSKSTPASSPTGARSQARSATTRGSGRSSTSPTARGKQQERKTA